VSHKLENFNPPGALPQKSKGIVGYSQYRNAVASGRTSASQFAKNIVFEADPTLPRYGTDLLQVLILTFEANLHQGANERISTQNTQNWIIKAGGSAVQSSSGSQSEASYRWTTSLTSSGLRVWYRLRARWRSHGVTIDLLARRRSARFRFIHTVPLV
jgi:hypothetical protein